MVFWIAGVVGLAIAYLFGSVPTGYLAGKLLKGIDIREHDRKRNRRFSACTRDCRDRQLGLLVATPGPDVY